MTTPETFYYTVQAKSAWEIALEKGGLYGNQAFCDADFLAAYEWMVQQMALRLPQFGGGYPVWVWPTRPIWRDGSFGKPQALVLIEAKLTQDRVLLSDFQSWHAVLNKFPILAHQDEKIEMQASWERIFDFEFLENSPDWGEVEIQGVVESISLGEIISVEDFSGKQIF